MVIFILKFYTPSERNNVIIIILGSENKPSHFQNIPVKLKR